MQEGAERCTVESGGVEGQNPQSQVSGGDVDGPTFKLHLLGQLLHSLQSSEESRRKVVYPSTAGPNDSNWRENTHQPKHYVH